jgi:hypothetical protein
MPGAYIPVDPTGGFSFVGASEGSSTAALIGVSAVGGVVIPVAAAMGVAAASVRSESPSSTRHPSGPRLLQKQRK